MSNLFPQEMTISTDSPLLRMAKAREDLVKEKHELKEQLGMVEMKLDGAVETNKRLTEEKSGLEHKLHDTGTNDSHTIGDHSIFFDTSFP